MKLSIRWKLILSITLPLLFVYLTVLALVFGDLKKQAYVSTSSKLQNIAQRNALELDSTLNKLGQISRSTASFLTLKPDLNDNDLFAIVSRNVRRNDLVYGSCIALEPDMSPDDRRLFAPYAWKHEDKVMNMDIAVEAYDYTEWDWFSIPRDLKKSVWGKPYFDEGAGNVVMSTHSSPFYKKGEFAGIATIDIKLDELQTIFSKLSLSEGGFVIFDRDGTFISHPDPDFIMKKTVFERAQELGHQDLIQKYAERIKNGEQVVMVAKGFPFEGSNFIVTAPIPSTGWTFSVAVPEKVIMGPVWGKLSRLSGILILGLLVILGIVFIASHKITRPLRALVKAVRQMAIGELAQKPLKVASDDELGELTRTFNTMTGALRKHVELLTQETAKRESVESELRVARNIQSSLIPRTFPPYPDRKEFDLHGTNLPARYVAGDFFDFFFVSKDKLMIVLADVSGKGIPAAMLMAVTRTIIRNAGQTGCCPSKVMTQTNKLLVDDNDMGMFVTAIVMTYDCSNGTYYLCNAGHDMPLIFDLDGNVKKIESKSNPVLGLFEEQSYEESKGKLNIGDALSIMTDGIVEARNHNGEFWGQDKLESFLSDKCKKTLPDISRLLMGELDRFQNHHPFDDATLVMLRRNS